MNFRTKGTGEDVNELIGWSSVLLLNLNFRLQFLSKNVTEIHSDNENSLPNLFKF